ncbi:CoA ester lyase [Spiractinospora alimapuensis]|uniref:HpcH/HpaI aldolase/citrate lyase family protein n=1 Tax=Spiractinospora alimapuensis TaxID=2820884 RepID=UPI001F39E162|nr:CoA ester lyase [Spiractinospora alimapuensis]QVQ52227.1 CoA ester lyase [Spiractinospora alimapuensis]
MPPTTPSTAELTRRLRTVLFVPGDRPDRIPKAAASGSTAIAIDLEDAVAESRKEEARQHTVDAITALPTDGPLVAVRVNAPDTGLADGDVAALADVLHRVDAVIVPMSSAPEQVRHVSGLLADAEERAGVAPGRVRLIPLVETARGILDAREVAAADPRVLTMSFGPADLSHELGVVPTAEGGELAVARSLLVLAAAAANLPRPIDGPHLDLDDEAGLRVSARRARALGFAGKQVIHPRQIPVVADVFAPTADEVAWARRVDEAFGAAERTGVSSIRLEDGTFVDYPIAARARAILAEAR